MDYRIAVDPSEANASNDRCDMKCAAAHTVELVDANSRTEVAQTHARLSGDCRPGLARRLVTRSAHVTSEPRSHVDASVRRDDADGCRDRSGDRKRAEMRQLTGIASGLDAHEVFTWEASHRQLGSEPER